MTQEETKALGGVGALLMVIGPFSGSPASLLGIVGLILVLIALKRLSDYYKEGGIFNNALYGAVTVIIGGIVSVTVIVVTALDFLSDLGIEITAWSDWTVLEQIDWEALVTWDILLPHIAVVIGSLVALFVFVVVAAIFLRRSLTVLSAKTGVNLFSTIGLLTLIGAVLTIIVVGFIVLWIALILLAVAFFSIKTQSAQPPTTTPS